MDMLPDNLDQLFFDIWQEYSRNETKIGRLLIHAQSLMGHGEFCKWVSDFKFSRRTAYRYMRLSKADSDRFPDVV